MEDSDKLTMEGAREQLMKQEECLLKTREIIQQQLAVLKAEEVTIRRLVLTHTNPELGQLEMAGKGSEAESMLHSEPDPERLPELNLDTQPTMLETSKTDEEYDSEEDLS